MLSDTLEKAKQENRAPWNDIELNTTEFIVYRGTEQDSSLIVPKVSTQESMLKCFQFAMEMGNINVKSEKNKVVGYEIDFKVGNSFDYPHIKLTFCHDN